MAAKYTVNQKKYQLRPTPRYTQMCCRRVGVILSLPRWHKMWFRGSLPPVRDHPEAHIRARKLSIIRSGRYTEPIAAQCTKSTTYVALATVSQRYAHYRGTYVTQYKSHLLPRREGPVTRYAVIYLWFTSPATEYKERDVSSVYYLFALTLVLRICNSDHNLRQAVPVSYVTQAQSSIFMSVRLCSPFEFTGTPKKGNRNVAL